MASHQSPETPSAESFLSGETIVLMAVGGIALAAAAVVLISRAAYAFVEAASHHE